MALDVTPKPDAERLKAFELYLESKTNGKYRSLRNIASSLGVSAMTVSRWAKVDNWDGQIKKVLGESTKAAESTSNALKRRVRRGLLDGLEQLQEIASSDKTSARDKIAAVKALSEIAMKLDAVTQAAGGEINTNTDLEFKDDLDAWQTTENAEKPEPLPVDDGLKVDQPPKPEVSESQLPSSEEALALISEAESQNEKASE